MHIAIGQVNPTIGDFEGNRRKILEGTRKAHEQGADLVVFPEMSLCGYSPMDLLDHNAFVQENLKALRKLQKQVPPEIAVAVGYVDKNYSQLGKPLRNVVSIIQKGEILHTQAKTLLPSYDVFDESRYFEPARERSVFRFGDIQVGIAICEDLWWDTEPAPGTKYSLDPVRDLLDQGADLILAPSASPFLVGKSEKRVKLISGISKSSGVPVVYVNMIGGNDSLIFDGNSLVTSCEGKLIFKGPAFEEQVSIFDMDEAFSPCADSSSVPIGRTTDARAPARSLDTSEGHTSSVPGGRLDSATSEARTSSVPIGKDKYEEMLQALVLGLSDYLGKTGFSDVHFGLSGGVDSALTAVVAVKALGPEHVTAFALPSRYSSDQSMQDAEKLAENLGISLIKLPIEEIFAASLGVLGPVFEGREPDVAEENVQARIRGMLLMGYANKFGSLLLNTGNKSELAVGYCTLYGDMCGGLSVLGDLLKTEVYGLCEYINREETIIPASIITKAPSAELRPEQKDEDSLPPYELLDRLLTRYLIENKTSEELISEGFAPDLVEKVLRLVARSEYKRRQAPPVLKISPRAFGTGRRMPIARAVYES